MYFDTPFDLSKSSLQYKIIQLKYVLTKSVVTTFTRYNKSTSLKSTEFIVCTIKILPIILLFDKTT